MFIPENVSENIVCKMETNFVRRRWVKKLWLCFYNTYLRSSVDTGLTYYYMFPIVRAQFHEAFRHVHGNDSDRNYNNNAYRMMIGFLS